MLLSGRTILLIISGGIAAYKALELVRLLKKSGARVVPVLTKGGAQFITPLSVSALAEEKTYGDLFSLTDEAEMGHIRLSRIADLVVVAPASADLMSKMAHGLADDLASTVLLAGNKPVLLAPAMNPAMWQSPAMQATFSLLKAHGAHFVGPVAGDTACGEEGVGRMAEPAQIFTAIHDFLTIKGPLSGKRVVVTAGATQEPIDPVRFIGNRASGKQGYAIAAALQHLGAEVRLVSGPTHLPVPSGVAHIPVTTADEMFKAVQEQLPADVAVCNAAVADFRAKLVAQQKIKKDAALPTLELEKTPDILAEISKPSAMRPKLVIGFAAETEQLEAHARAKLAKKACDWLLANDVSATTEDVFGADFNTIHFFSADAVEHWPRMRKDEVAKMLAEKIVNFFLLPGHDKD